MRIVGDTFVRSERVPYAQTHLPHDGYGTHSPDQPYVRRRMFAKRKKLLKKKIRNKYSIIITFIITKYHSHYSIYN